jgi:hypothetical protein
MQTFEHFIPISRRGLRAACVKAFQEPLLDNFAALLEAYIHHQHHEQLESLKRLFEPWDPDLDTVSLGAEPADEAILAQEDALVTQVKNVLTQANYRALSQSQLERALAEDQLLSLDMSIDFNDFSRCLVYWRGEALEEAPVPAGMLTWCKEIWRKVRFAKPVAPAHIKVFKRMVLLLRFQEEAYFTAQGRDIDKLSFTPGKMYVYLYKSIPQRDVEILFPNVNIRMTWRDRLFFIVPAMGAAIPMMIKALPQIVLLIGVIFFFFGGPQSAQRLGVGREQVQQFLPILLAVLSLGVMFGGFAFKQYLNYKNKRLKFLKDVSDTLFFKNLVSNAGVFHSLIDAAEEEICKEVLLALCVLWQHPDGLSMTALDQKIEAWLADLGVEVDFHVEKALHVLAQIRYDETALVFQQEERWHVAPLPEACRVLDGIWDNLYPYANPVLES